MIYLSKSDIQKIESLASGKVIFKSLKNWRAFTRKKILKQYPITPFPYYLYSETKKFKLLLAEKHYEYQLKEIFEVNNNISHLNFSPKILINSDNFLLIEYFEGNFPKFSDKRFVEQIAHNLAKLHLININYEKTEKVIEKIKSNKGIFKNYNIDIEKIVFHLFKKLPSSLKTSYTYGDHNRSNYIFHNNSLKLIDLGSFRSSQIQDLDLLVSGMFEVLDKNYFWKKYTEINNDKFIFNNIFELSLLGYMLNFIYNDFRLKKSPFYDLRVKYHKKQNLINLAHKINRFLNA